MPILNSYSNVGGGGGSQGLDLYKGTSIMVAENNTSSSTETKVLEYNGSGYIPYYYMYVVATAIGNYIRIEIDDELCFEFGATGSANMQLIKPITVAYGSGSSQTWYYVYYDNTKTISSVEQSKVEDKHLDISFGLSKVNGSSSWFWYADYPFIFKNKLKITIEGNRRYNFLINYTPTA